MSTRPEISEPALDAVRDGGVLVEAYRSQHAGADPRYPGLDGACAARRHPALAELSRGVEEGWLRLRVAGTFPLDEVAKAHELAATAGLRGRVVLTA